MNKAVEMGTRRLKGGEPGVEARGIQVGEVDEREVGGEILGVLGHVFDDAIGAVASGFADEAVGGDVDAEAAEEFAASWEGEPGGGRHLARRVAFGGHDAEASVAGAEGADMERDAVGR